MNYKQGDRVVIIRDDALPESYPYKKGDVLIVLSVIPEKHLYIDVYNRYLLAEEVIPEVVYNSRLYKALQEDE